MAKGMARGQESGRSPEAAESMVAACEAKNPNGWVLDNVKPPENVLILVNDRGNTNIICWWDDTAKKLWRADGSEYVYTQGAKWREPPGDDW